MSSESSPELNQVRAELEATTGKIGSVVQLVTESGISVDTVKEELMKLEERKRFLEKHLHELSLKNKVTELSEEAVNELLERPREFIRTHNLAECQNFIDSYVKKVLVFNDRVEVFFKINIPDEKTGDIVPLKSAEGTQELHREYKSVPKGWNSIETVLEQ